MWIVALLFILGVAIALDERSKRLQREALKRRIDDIGADEREIRGFKEAVPWMRVLKDMFG
jgi:hypothetical protein